jgi:hypothetical protein
VWLVWGGCVLKERLLEVEVVPGSNTNSEKGKEFEGRMILN